MLTQRPCLRAALKRQTRQLDPSRGSTRPIRHQPAQPRFLRVIGKAGAPILSSILSRPPMMSPPTLSSRGWGVRGASSRQWPPWAANAHKRPMYVAPHLADGPHGQQTYKAASLNDEPTHAFFACAGSAWRLIPPMAPWAANALSTPMYVAPHLADGPHGQQTYKV